jgi:hypothetical protein
VASNVLPKQETTRRISPPMIITGVVLLVVAAIGGLWYWKALHAPKEAIVLTPEARAYSRNLDLGNVEMKAVESYAQQQIVEITGSITNKGDRTLQLVELNCVFNDPYGQVVLRERVPIVKLNGGGLAPGKTINFRLPFDALPAAWNQALPQLVIARISFT